MSARLHEIAVVPGSKTMPKWMCHAGGDVGRVALCLRRLLELDQDPQTGPPSMFTRVPYGYLTGMID